MSVVVRAAVVALLVQLPALAGAQAEPVERPEADQVMPPPAERDGGRVLGRMGLGTFSRVRFDVGDGAPALEVDTIGLRYWFPGRGPHVARAWGIDLGIAFAFERETIEAEGVESKFRSTAIGFHGGVPLVLAQLPHANFEVVPEVDVVFLGGDRAGADLSGVALAIGARAGFEVFFGFIGVPDLSLDASVGFGLRHVRAELEQGGATTSRETTFVGLQKLADPWDIFRTSVAARYYF